MDEDLLKKSKEEYSEFPILSEDQVEELAIKPFKEARIKMILGLASTLMHSFYVLSFLNMERPKYLMFAYSYGPLHWALNDLTQDYEKYDAILITEWDHEFPPDTLKKLWEDNKPVVAAIYKSRNDPRHPFCLMMEKEKGKGVTYVQPSNFNELGTVDVCGMGFMLVRKEVFDKIEKPFFEFGDNSYYNSDRCFCRKLRKHGFKVWVDPRARIGHLINDVIT